MSSSTPKKRKATSPSSSSKKKSRSQASKSLETVTIQVQKPDAAVDPVLVSFPGGVPSIPPAFSWKLDRASNPASRAIQGHDGNGCFYKATSNGLLYDDRSTKMCVGIYDKHTGVLTLHQTASKGTVYALQQHLPAYKETLQAEMTDEGQVYAATQALFEDFGSAKKKKVLKSQQANRVNVDTVIGSGMDYADAAATMNNKMSESNRQAVQDAKQNAGKGPAFVSAIEAAHEKARKALLPPFDRNADQACEFYQFKKMVEPSAWRHISKDLDFDLNKDEDDFVHAFTNHKPRPARDGSGKMEMPPPPEKRGWSKTVLEALRHADSSGLVERARGESASVAKSSASAKYQLRCIALLHHMIRFYGRFQTARPGPGQPQQRRRGRPNIVKGIDESDERWNGMPISLATCLFEQFATKHEVKTFQSNAEQNSLNSNRAGSIPGYIMSPTNKDKCLVSILLLYLRARGGAEMKLDDLTSILKDLPEVDATKATQLLRTAGCSVLPSSVTRKTRVVLTVPVTFPRPKGKGRR